MNNLLNTLETAIESQKSLDLEIAATQAIEESPNQAFGYYALAEANWIKGAQQKAEVCLAKAIELEPTNASYLLRLAQWKEEQLEYHKAKILYLKALDADPQQVQALKGLANYYLLHDSQYEKAAQLLELAIEQDAQDAELYLLYAQALLEANREEEALEALQKSIEIAPEETAFVLKINAHVSLEESEEVKASYEELMKLSDDPNYAIRYANYLLNEEQYEAAAQQLQKLLTSEQVEDKQPLRGLLGLAFMGQQQYSDAIAVFDQMAAEDDSDEEIFVQRAKAKAQNGDLAGAIADLKIAISKVSEENQPPIQFELAQLHLQAKDYSAAEAIFKALADHPLYEADGLYGLGMALHQQGDQKGAFTVLQKAQKLKNHRAKDYLYEHFGEQLAARAAKILDKLQAEIEKNQQSKALQPLFGQCFVFDLRRNKVDANLPKEVQEKLKSALADTSFVLTANGLILLNPIEKRALRAGYRIVEEEENELDLQIFPLDGSPSFELSLEVNGANLLLEPQLAKAQAVHLQPQKWARLSTQQQNAWKQYLAAEDVSFLGDAGSELAALW